MILVNVNICYYHTNPIFMQITNDKSFLKGLSSSIFQLTVDTFHARFVKRINNHN